MPQHATHDPIARATYVARMQTIVSLSDRAFHTMSREELEAALRAIANVARKAQEEGV